MAEKLNIRDFIYLDVERMKSIFSQIHEGIIEQSTEEKGGQKNISAGGSGHGGIPGFAKLKGEISGGILWENKETETKTLHDHMFNIVEEVLRKEDSIYVINGNDKKIKKAWKDGALSQKIPDNAFVLIKGRVMIDDYSRFEQIARNFNELSTTFGGFQNMNFDDSFISSIFLLMNLFYQNELFIKVLPYQDNPYLRFIGNLNREFLRDPIESITFKYGTYPVSEWYFFGQISSIFPKGYNPLQSFKKTKYGKIFENAGNANTILTNLANSGTEVNSNQDLDGIDLSTINNVSEDDIKLLKSLKLNNFDFYVLKNVGMDMVFESVFNGVREADYIFSTKFPAVTFTPIAVYRGD